MLQLTKDVIEWIRDYFAGNEDGKAIIGISGGKDSTICAALLVEALGKDRVIGVLMPNGEQKDIEDSYRVCRKLDIKAHVINVGPAYADLVNSIYDSDPDLAYPAPETLTTNLPARLRMATLYAIAALYPNSRVVNTSNFSERYVGYSTKYGDGAGDFSPLGNLTVTHVLAIGDDLWSVDILPYDLVHKEPSDGMSGKTDEYNLGFTYKQLDDYLLGRQELVPDEVKEMITARHRANYHKLQDMPRYDAASIYLKGMVKHI